MSKKNIVKIIGGIIVIAIVLAFIPGKQIQSPIVFSGVWNVPSFNTASSSVQQIGSSSSVIILSQRGARSYARICNADGGRVFLSFSSTVITSTSSADTLIASGECYEINKDKLYTGEVQAIADNATSTELMVYELVGF